VAVEIVAAALLPGLLAGMQITGLLFFLNPHLEFSAEGVLRGFLLYGGLLGALSLLLHLPFTWGRPERARRALPWSLTVVLAASALGDWVHASLYAYYLPPGMNRRLLKAAVLLSVGAVVGFYTTLAHRPHGRPYGLRSRLLYAFLIFGSIYVVLERREAFEATPPADEPRPTTVVGRSRPQILVVGLEGATLDAILPLAQSGRLPFFARMLEEGAHGRLSTLEPPLRETIWTTLGTGKYPYQHGIVGHESYTMPPLGPEAILTLLPKMPKGLEFKRWGTFGESRRLDAHDKRSLDAWEILDRLDVATAVVGWPLTSPVSAEARIFVSERFFEDEELKTVYPEDFAERARLFRTEVEEIDPAAVSRFGTDAPRDLLESLAGDLWRESLAFFLLDQGSRTEALFLTLPGLSKVSLSYFGGFAAVNFEGLQDPSSVEGAQLLSAYYAHLDEFLADLWQRRTGPQILVVTSARGTESLRGYRELRRQLFRQPALRGSFRRSPSGVLMMMGEGIQPGAVLARADLVDLAPTLLYCLGFPVADDLDGKLLTEALDTAFLARQPLTFIPSYENLVD